MQWVLQSEPVLLESYFPDLPFPLIPYITQGDLYFSAVTSKALATHDALVTPLLP